MTDGTTIHLMQMSLQFSRKPRKVRKYVRKRLKSKRPDVVGFTEGSNFRKQLRKACKAAGYRLYFPRGGDVALAVRRDHDLLCKGQHKVVPARGGTGAHAGRFVRWVKVKIGPEIVTVHEDHFITIGKWPRLRARRANQRLTQARENLRLMRKHSKGTDLSFFMGDTNFRDTRKVRNALDRVWRDKMVSIYDDLNKYPATHGAHATLDWICRLRRDKRVHAKRVKVWKLGAGSDHRSVSAWYHVTPRKG